MIESKVKQSTSDIDFPKLMISETGLIVLFSSPKLGFVVKGDDLWKAGEHSETWIIDVFTDFHGSVTLSNGSK